MYIRQETHINQLNNILVVEDLPSWQKKFKRFLKDEPFNIVVATNYLEALILAELYAIELMVLDVNLSGVPYNIDGLRAAEELWCKNKNMKIIIVSGDQGWNRRLEVYGFDPNFVLEKQSLDQDDFVRKIYQALYY